MCVYFYGRLLYYKTSRVIFGGSGKAVHIFLLFCILLTLFSLLSIFYIVTLILVVLFQVFGIPFVHFYSFTVFLLIFYSCFGCWKFFGKSWYDLCWGCDFIMQDVDLFAFLASHTFVHSSKVCAEKFCLYILHLI